MSALQSFRVHQGLLVDQLKVIFPNVQTQTNKILKNPFNGEFVELDVYVPHHKLCFEFQDSYHYTPTWYFQNTQSYISAKDNTKHVLARRKELTLVVVPLWWDGNQSSLSDLINFQRPDLLENQQSHLISLNPPADYFSTAKIPGVGELMHASYSRSNDLPSRNISSWWMGEKYDGVRVCWNSSLHKVYTRYGTIFNLPKITNNMPNIFADGELWFGRGNYTIASNIATNPIEFHYWHLLRLLLFDVPSYNVQNRPFEIRYQHLLSSTDNGHPFYVIASRVVCKNKAHFREVISHVEKDGGEGVIIRKSGSPYERDRSPFLVKIKMQQADNEAILESSGGNSMVFKLPNGKSFTVPANSVQITPKPKIGDIVTYTYSINARRGELKIPSILRVRTDMSWENVVYKYYHERSDHIGVRRRRNYSNFVNVHKPKASPKRVWGDIKNRRKYFEEYARRKGFDPLDAESWYKQSLSKIIQAKGGHGVALHYKFKLYKALSDLFPNIGIERSKFKIFYRDWSTPEARRGFFEKFAKDNSFDPLVAENWYSQRGNIRSVMGGANVIEHHGTYERAIIDLFPDIGADELKFKPPRKTPQRISSSRI